MIRAISVEPPSALLGTAGLLAVLGMGVALLQPTLLLPMMAGVSLLAGLAVAARFPVGASVGWLVLVGSTPEMWLGDVVGGGPVIIGAVKLVGLALAGICILRYGPAPDLFNPGLAFLAMFALGLAHGLHPQLDMADSLRSLIGSVAPFAFAFSRLSRGWIDAVIRTTRWLPLILVGLGAVLAGAGLRPIFVVEGGFRLSATGHPAFLGGFALAAVEASLLELLRDGRRGNLVLLGLNFLILVLTGARAPLAIGLGLCAIAMLVVPSERFGRKQRITLALVAACAVPPLIAVASSLGAVRLFNMLSSEASNLSGRDLIWPWFQEAWDASPWFGWGVGAGRVIVPPESTLARLLGTNAAHNEYLRIGVDGGWVGLVLLIALFVLWTVRHTRVMPPPDRIVLRLVLLGFAIHAYTDNTLIATTSSVLFTWVSAVFARGAIERVQPTVATSLVQGIAVKG